MPHQARLLAATVAWAICASGAEQSLGVREAAAALERKDFAGAERKLRDEARAHPDDAWTLSLLGYTLDNQKRGQEAEPFHRRALELAPGTAEILNNYGTHLWIKGDYSQAEMVFAGALSAAPTYFNVLYNLGAMAAYAGHYERAREVLRSALQQQPNNVDVLYRLASVEEALKHWEDAAVLLAQAGRLDPTRADVQRLLAVTASELGALPDAAAAWDRYLALEPNDELARRESSYTAVKMGKLEQGIAGIERYLTRHRDDKVAYFELGQAQRSLDVTAAIQQFDHALTLDPKYGAALAARGSLYYQNGKFESARKDLEAADNLEPDHADTLDRLGQTYRELDRLPDALQAFRRAAELAPEDSKTLLHLGRALADSGRIEESKSVMERFRELGPEKKVVVPEGLVSYLSMTPEQRRGDYRMRVEKSVRERPDDAAAQLAWLKLLLEDRNAHGVADAARHIAALKPGAGVLATAGHLMLEAEYPALAKGLLQQVGISSFDLALATYRDGAPAATASAALAIMDRVPNAARGVDYHLACARMWESAGKPLEAAAERDRALRVVDEEARAQPDRREILLMRATTLEYANRTADALSFLKQMEARWPEWPAVWAAQGVILAIHGRYPEARPALEAASALGSRSPEACFFLVKTYAALGRDADGRKEQERLRAWAAIPASAEEAWYVGRFFEGGLLRP